MRQYQGACTIAIDDACYFVTYDVTPEEFPYPWSLELLEVTDMDDNPYAGELSEHELVAIVERQIEEDKFDDVC